MSSTYRESARRALALASILTLPFLPARTAKPLGDAASAIDALLQDAYKPDEPGAGVLVVKDGTTLLLRSFASSHTVNRLGQIRAKAGRDFSRASTGGF